MANLREVELIKILSELPDIQSLNVGNDLSGKKDCLFLCALGFEDRSPWIPELIRDIGSYKTNEAIYFEYATNVTDNDLNKPRLIAALQQFSTSEHSMQCDEEDFSARLRELLHKVCDSGETPSVAFDISACSSKLVQLVLKVLFEFNLNLRILYSEAALYHPTRDEYAENPEKWITEEGFGLAKGVGKVIPSPEHPGNRRDRLPEAIVVFPTFKPERTKAVITEVDESLITRAKDGIIWIVGDPHLLEDHWRADIMREINKIPDSAPSYEVSTFDYKKTLETLERVYQARDCKYHVNISPLGSKMQSVGIALFWYMRQDVSIVFAMPEEYNARQYSEGCKATWQINFGEINKVREILDSVGQLEIVSGN